MQLTKYITKPCILPEVASTAKADVLKELTHLLFDKRKMDGVANQALDQIMSREATESTGIGNGIAVPHARVAGIKQLVCSVGRVPAGMDFSAVDRNPVRIIFLICYPPTDQTTYLNFVATIARIWRDKENQMRIMEAASADEIFDVLDEVSSKFTERHEKDVKEMRDDPALENVPDTHANLLLLARLQLYGEMLDTSRTGKTQLHKRIEAIRKLVDPQILNHYDRLMKQRKPALVPVEGDTCQGCNTRLASKFVQQVRQDTSHIHTCNNCRRYIYVV